jgi:aminopeptidase N
VADPGSSENLFDTPVYDRRAMVLHELRLAVADPAFFTILRTWAAQHHYGHGTTARFTGLAARISHQNLTTLFHTWLYTAGKPAHA